MYTIGAFYKVKMTIEDIRRSRILEVPISQPLARTFQAANSVASGEFYLIGSTVRKCILGEPIVRDDIDFIGAFDFDKVQSYFGGQVVGRWDKFGTIKVLGNEREIDFINDSNIKAALERRDITLTLMCIDQNGIVYDPLHYIDDLKNRLIRIDKAAAKIQAEPDRVLRVLRFSATLGYDVESLTRQACIDYAYLMNPENTEYALNKFMSLSPEDRQKTLALAENWRIFGFVNDLLYSGNLATQRKWEQ